MIMKTFCHLLVACTLLCIVVQVHCGALNIQVKGHDTECVFLPKEKGDNIEFFLSVSSGSGVIDFTIFKPNSEVFLEKKRISEDVIEPIEVEEAGDYMFCFYNSYSRSETIVAFEYDLLLEHNRDDKGNVKKRVDKEKKNFLVRAVNTLRINMKPGEGRKQSYEDKQHQLWDMLKNNIKTVHNDHQVEDKRDEAIQKQLLLLGFYFDRIESFLDMHKSRVRRHHHLQLANNHNVMFYSIFICISIMIASVVQLVILKGFINGKMSWKVWKF